MGGPEASASTAPSLVLVHTEHAGRLDIVGDNVIRLAAVVVEGLV